MLGGFLADTTGVDIVDYRISGTWGPLGHTDPFFAAPALIHAAARGTAPDLSHLMGPAFAEDGIDLNYVPDTGRALALLQLADKLNHRTYNVGSGRATTNAQLIEAIKKVAPDAQVDLPTGGDTPRRQQDLTEAHPACGGPSPEAGTTTPDARRSGKGPAHGLVRTMVNGARTAPAGSRHHRDSWALSRLGARRTHARNGPLRIVEQEDLVFPEVRGLERVCRRKRQCCCGGTAGLRFRSGEQRREIDERSLFRCRFLKGSGVP